MNHKATLHVADAGPLLCGGITVFAPLARFAKPTDRVGIIGIGGLGHRPFSSPPHTAAT